jgi:hypothetical protein
MIVRSCLKLVYSISLVSTIFLLPSCSKDEDDEPVVTGDEGLYINEIYASGDDWIELFNNTASSKDIGGYKVFDDVSGKYTLPAGTTVPANGFLIIYCDDLNTGVHANFKLSATGETIYLESKTDVIDKVIYPALDNGQSYGRYPDGSATFAVSGITTQGSSNGNTNAPAIESVTRNPLVVSMEDDVAITANFVSITGITSVTLFHRVNQSGNFISTAMTQSNGAYVATIPALNDEGRVDYYVEATNAAGTANNPNSAPQKTHYYLMTNDELPDLVINEYLASNTSCCPDTDSGMDEFDDWIEIRNNGATAVDVGGMYLSDDNANPFNYRIPDSNPTLTTIPAGGYLLVWADNETDQGDLHLDFGLSTDGEDLGLYYFDGRPIDQFSFPPQTENVSMARKPDGTGSFEADATPSPKAAN